MQSGLTSQAAVRRLVVRVLPALTDTAAALVNGARQTNKALTCHARIHR